MSLFQYIYITMIFFTKYFNLEGQKCTLHLVGLIKKNTSSRNLTLIKIETENKSIIYFLILTVNLN